MTDREYGWPENNLLSQNIVLKIIFIVDVIKYITNGYLSVSQKTFEHLKTGGSEAKPFTWAKADQINITVSNSKYVDK